MEKQKAVIWGASERAVIYKVPLSRGFDFLGFIDNNKLLQGTVIADLPVLSPDDLQKNFETNTMVIVFVTNYPSVVKQLADMGFYNIIIFELQYKSAWDAILRGVIFPKDITTYSYCGEDIIVDAIFRPLKKTDIKYAEVGVLNAITNSNTYLFYSRGNRGILVDANPDVRDEVVKLRPLDKYVSTGIGDKRGSVELLTTKNGISTFDKFIAKMWSSNSAEDEVKKTIVPVVTFDDLFLNEDINYLSIDIDGWDEQVLCSVDFSKYPELLVIVSETVCNENVREHMTASGFVFFASTNSNEIYLRENILDSVLTSYENKRLYEFMKFINSSAIPWLV